MSKNSLGSTRVNRRHGKYVMTYTIPDPSKPRGWAEHMVTGDGTEETAWANKFAMQARIDAGEFAEKGYTFGEAAERYIQSARRKELTKQSYRYFVRTTLAGYVDMPMSEMATKRAEVVDLLSTAHAGYQIAAMVSEIFDKAMREQKCGAHLMSKLSQDVPPKPQVNNTPVEVSADELVKLLDNMNPRYRLVILLARGCGLRRGEATALHTDAISPDFTYLEVKRSTTNAIDGLPKKRYEGFTPRKVPIPHWLEPILREHIEQYATEDGRLFPSFTSRRSRYIMPHAINRMFKDAVIATGLETGNLAVSKNVTLQSLRKNYATQLRAEAAELGIDWFDVKQWLGHKDLTIDVYAQQSIEVITKGRNLSDPRSDS